MASSKKLTQFKYIAPYFKKWGGNLPAIQKVFSSKPQRLRRSSQKNPFLREKGNLPKHATKRSCFSTPRYPPAAGNRSQKNAEPWRQRHMVCSCQDDVWQIPSLELSVPHDVFTVGTEWDGDGWLGRVGKHLCPPVFGCFFWGTTKRPVRIDGFFGKEISQLYSWFGVVLNPQLVATHLSSSFRRTLFIHCESIARHDSETAQYIY